jgi:hypothetical protein
MSLLCFAAAGAWPSLTATLESALMSPLQRAVTESICGQPFHTSFEVLGHCAACWAGSAILLAAGVIVLVANRRSSIAIKADA